MKTLLLKVPEHIDPYVEETLLKNIDVNKREVICKYVNKKDRYRSLLGINLVRYICSEELYIEGNEIIFGYNKYGKPYLFNYNNFHFNISHSGNWVVCAYGGNSVGVDVEEIVDIDLNITKFFAEEEKKYIYSGKKDEIQERFFDIWTLKESYIKAVGMGMSIELHSFAVSIQGLKPKLLSGFNDNSNFYFKQYKLPNYKLSVCSTSNNFNNKLQYIDLDTLLEFIS
ncbi:4'-phosphopantetheinyl transferase family protein [Bacillus wiedmannii]|uniref:4'-phosphopantetheinyl transferase family protein n=1 Tax=Bacillus wiedmannii TaxID=1890302 RepID=UPI000BF13321|nr:4'-phosphopantetheinyl transferase superfamily protein [Bacillus wiedmannii]PEM20850.1 phosphopantetheine-protein transferase [Bacillus wiedmannii]